jgi:hypothetical protein
VAYRFSFRYFPVRVEASFSRSLYMAGSRVNIGDLRLNSLPFVAVHTGSKTAFFPFLSPVRLPVSPSGQCDAVIEFYCTDPSFGGSLGFAFVLVIRVAN